MDKKIDKRCYFDIVKGIAILSIVIGHTCHFMSRFVYLYHIVIFFFVSSYLFSEKKYGNRPVYYSFIRFKKNYKFYIFYAIIFVLLHNVFIDLHLINSNLYDMKDTLIALARSFLFKCPEPFGGAFWFLPVLIVSSSIFAFVLYFTKKIKTQKISNVMFLLLNIIFSIVGYILCKKNIYLTFNIQISFLVMPICAIGFYMKKYKEKLCKAFKYKNILEIIAFIFSFLFLLLCVNKFNFRVDLSANIVPFFPTFLFISICGIYLVCYLAKIIINIPIIKKYFEFIGKYSFDIMALHFFIIKIVDVIYSFIINEKSISTIAHFPTAFSKQLWLVYIIIGTSIPALIGLYKYKFENKLHLQDGIAKKKQEDKNCVALIK